ncbi:MAG: histidinol dehydrogenase [Candidatus Gracilibacteria bacterium]|jgi:histidinol dehydrogenase
MKILNTRTSSMRDILQQIRKGRSKAEDVKAVVLGILNEIKISGDSALRAFNKKFDGFDLEDFKVTNEEIKRAYKMIDLEVLRALKRAKSNIEKFHKSTLQKRSPIIETEKGVKVWREFRPIEKVGLYVPGGKAAYPSTVLMLGVPAQVAGCKEIVMCAPASKNGQLNPAILVAADLCGITEIFKVGGAQAIGAMAYGTESIPKVYKIFGPGNQYVTTAKMLVYGEVDIDMPAGPSEVEVIADNKANPAWVAADLLSQLEHGTDSQSILVTFDENTAANIVEAMKVQVLSLSRKAIIDESFAKSFVIVVKDPDEAIELTNEYAPEHLEIDCKFENQLAEKINNAGSVFLGKYASEPLGDYATGANHTLPTSSFAKMFSPLSTESFGKMLQFQKVSRQGIRNLKETVETLAECEGLDAHKNAVSIRFKT